MNINDIKPKTQGKSDKYSWNLYAYLKKNRGTHRILWDNSKDKQLNPMYIYVLQGTIGRSLQSIMWNVRGDTYCYSAFPLDTYADITDTFWESYVAKGRCVFLSHSHPWIQGDEHRYTMLDDDTKVCQWCGEVLRKRVETVVKTVEHWEALLCPSE